MITRSHSSARLGHRTATYSECENYRYSLTIRWSDGPRILTCCGLNPSTATEKDDDRTIAKVVRLAKKWNYDAMCMVNLFAFRATDPKVMLKAKDPRGWQNTSWIFQSAGTDVLCAWGRGGNHANEGNIIKATLAVIGANLFHLGLNFDGTPKHPLYLAEKDLEMTPWS